MAELKRAKAKSWIAVCSVKSESDQSKRYTISMNRDGHLGCPCKGWIFGPRTENGERTCKHLNRHHEVLQDLAVLALEEELALAALSDLFGMARDARDAARTELARSGLLITRGVPGWIVVNKVGETVARAATERGAVDAANYALKS